MSVLKAEGLTGAVNLPVIVAVDEGDGAVRTADVAFQARQEGQLARGVSIGEEGLAVFQRHHGDGKRGVVCGVEQPFFVRPPCGHLAGIGEGRGTPAEMPAEIGGAFFGGGGRVAEEATAEGNSHCGEKRRQTGG